jgi:hypothetical protein
MRMFSGVCNMFCLNRKYDELLAEEIVPRRFAREWIR